MRKSILNLLGGAFFGLLTLTFTACGNIDNPLEEIGNSNSKVAALAGALDEGAEVTFNFTMQGEAYVQFLNELINNQDVEIVGQNESISELLETGSLSMKVVFKKKSGKYEYELSKAYVGGDEISEQDYEYYSRLFALEYVSKNNQLKVSLVGVNDVNDDAGVEEGGGFSRTRALYAYPDEMPLTTVIFDLNDDSYSQYVYPYMAYVVLKSIYVNGKDMTNLLENKYPKPVSFYRYNGVMVQHVQGPIVGTRGEQAEETPEQKELFCLFYKDNETWADVNKRYKNEAGTALLDEPGDDGFAYLDSYIDNIPGMPFYYNEDVDNNEELTQVKYSEKVGYKGTTALQKGYVMIMQNYIFGGRDLIVNNNPQ